jgi:hypothetical protein
VHLELYSNNKQTRCTVFLLYLFITALYVSGPCVAHHQEVKCIMWQWKLFYQETSLIVCNVRYYYNFQNTMPSHPNMLQTNQVHKMSWRSAFTLPFHLHLDYDTTSNRLLHILYIVITAVTYIRSHSVNYNFTVLDIFITVSTTNNWL